MVVAQEPAAGQRQQAVEHGRPQGHELGAHLCRRRRALDPRPMPVEQQLDLDLEGSAVAPRQHVAAAIGQRQARWQRHAAQPDQHIDGGAPQLGLRRAGGDLGGEHPIAEVLDQQDALVQIEGRHRGRAQAGAPEQRRSWRRTSACPRPDGRCGCRPAQSRMRRAVGLGRRIHQQDRAHARPTAARSCASRHRPADRRCGRSASAPGRPGRPSARRCARRRRRRCRSRARSRAASPGRRSPRDRSRCGSSGNSSGARSGHSTIAAPFAIASSKPTSRASSAEARR